MPFTIVSWRVRTGTLSTGDHTLVMGILNVTPDSFSDGGRFAGDDATERAVAAGREMWDRGADIVDVGGESTRPGAEAVETAEETDRVVPVVAGLAAQGIVVSVDTREPEVAAAAVDAGAAVVNDVSALRDPAMAEVCAAGAVGVVLMHMRGEPRTMQADPRYEDVVADVGRYLDDRISAVVAAGIERDRLCIDPGIGFGKTGEHNLELLAGLRRLVATGVPVLVGASRKRFLGDLLDAAGHPAAAPDRDAATAATTALAVAAGAAVVRVHDVPGTVQVARIADAIVRRTGGDSGWSGQ